MKLVPAVVAGGGQVINKIIIIIITITSRSSVAISAVLKGIV